MARPSASPASSSARILALGLPLGPRLGRDPIDLGKAEPILDAREIGRHRGGDHAGVARPVVPLGRKAPAGQMLQLGIGSAVVEPARASARSALAAMAGLVGPPT